MDQIVSMLEAVREANEEQGNGIPHSGMGDRARHGGASLRARSKDSQRDQTRNSESKK